MNILVYDVAASDGGALAILKYFYNIHKEDKNNNYFYLLSDKHVEETDNIKIIVDDKVKKSWLHRVFCDVFVTKKIIKKYKIEEVLSLQNIIIPFCKLKQTVYEHNALPFCEYRFSFFGNKKMWVYQNIIGRMMINSIKRAKVVIVQTEWMKEAVSKYLLDNNKVIVDFPQVDIPKGVRYSKQKQLVFFYPANASSFKNHLNLVKALSLFDDCIKTKMQIVFTLNGNENKNISKVSSFCKKENINVLWIGQIDRDLMFDYYKSSILVFPSYIETIGLPLFEAKSIESPIVCSELSYSKNIVGSYEKAIFFNPFDINSIFNSLTLAIGEFFCNEN